MLEPHIWYVADDVRNHAEDGEDKEHDEVNPAQAVSTMAALVSTKDKAALNVEAMEALERQRDKSILAQVLTSSGLVQSIMHVLCMTG